MMLIDELHITDGQCRMPITPFGSIIRAARKRAKLSQGELAARIGKEQPYISQVETGKSQLPDDMIVKRLAWELGLDEEQLFKALGVRVVVGAALTVPVIGLIPADTVRWTSREGVTVAEIHVLEEDIKRAQYPKEVYGLQVTGDCMRSLRIQHGDIVIVEPPHGRVPQNGDLVVVRIGDEVSLKRWSMFGESVELRDGEGNIVWRGSSEGLEVVAFYVGWKPSQPV